MKALLALLLAVALGVGLAATFVPDQAATIGGVGISQSTLNGDLSAIAHSPYRCVLQTSGTLPSSLGAAGNAGITTGRNGGYSVTFARTWLEILIEDQLFADLVSRQHLDVSPALATLAATSVEQTISSALPTKAGTPTTTCAGKAATVLGALPGSLRQQIETAATDKLVLTMHAAGVAPNESGLASYYRSHPKKFLDHVCATIVEFRTSTPTAAATAAGTLSTKLAAGTTTITTAMAAVTAATPTGTTKVAGQTCQTIFGKSATLTATAAKVYTAPKGTLVTLDLTAQTPNTSKKARKVYLLSVITSQQAVPFSAQTVVEVLHSLQETKVDTAAGELLRTTPLTVNPRYGTFSATGFASPASPPVTATPAPAANAPGGRQAC